MHILVWGASPLAGWLAAYLQDHHQVRWLADETIKTAIEGAGALKLQSPTGAKQASNLTLYTRPEDCLKPPLDWIILAMPAWGVGEAALTITHYIPPTHYPQCLVFSNGHGVFEKVEALLGEGKATQAINTRHVEWVGTETGTPDFSQIRTDGQGDVVVEQNDRGADIIAALQVAQFQPTQAERIALTWSYVFWQLQANALPSLLDVDPREVYQNPILWEIEAAQIWEARRVIRRLNIKLMALPNADVPRIARLTRWLPPQFLAPRLIPLIKPLNLKTDLLLNTGRSDAAYLNGAIAAAAYNLRIPAPVNHVLAIAITDIAEGRARWSQFQNNVEYLQTHIRIATPTPRKRLRR